MRAHCSSIPWISFECIAFGPSPVTLGRAYHLRVQMECAGRTESGEATGTSMGGLRLAPLVVN